MHIATSKIVLCIAIALTCQEMTENIKREIVDYHNELRASVNPIATDMLDVKWDDEIYMLARHWADACLRKSDGNFFHDINSVIPGRYTVGQNIGNGHKNFRDVITHWFAEKDLYMPWFGKRLEDPAVLATVDHYTQQLDWVRRIYVLEDTIYVCNYGTAGNMHGFSRPYSQGTTRGEQCMKKTSSGLCDCGGLTCENDGTLDVATCSCTCLYPQSLTGPSCALNCSTKPAYFCGNQQGFMESKCNLMYLQSACPRMCGICPCYEVGYNPVMCRVSVTRIPSFFILMLSVYMSLTC